jgi:hypothetical protein
VWGWCATTSADVAPVASPPIEISSRTFQFFLNTLDRIVAGAGEAFDSTVILNA